MKTKKKLSIIIVVVLLIISNHSYSQIYSSDNAKSIIKTIWLAYMANGAQGCLYTEPVVYINEPGTNNVIGQNFINYSGGNYCKFDKIVLNITGDKITGAKLNNAQVNLTWSDNRISKMKIEGVAYCNYALNYNALGEIIGLTSNEPRDNKVASLNIEYKDGLIDKVTQYFDKIGSKKPWLNYVSTRSYTNNKVVVNTIIYKRDKGPKPENISSNTTKYYTKINDNNLVTEEQNFKKELTFDDNNMLIAEKFLSFGRLQTHTYKYIKGELFSDENIETKDNVFIQKTITVKFSLENQPESLPNFEKMNGVYKFNQNNELIFEKNNGRYREKVNGVWSDWKNTIY